jgi:hypothetical protein
MARATDLLSLSSAASIRLFDSCEKSSKACSSPIVDSSARSMAWRMSLVVQPAALRMRTQSCRARRIPLRLDRAAPAAPVAPWQRRALNWFVVTPDPSLLLGAFSGPGGLGCQPPGRQEVKSLRCLQEPVRRPVVRFTP